MIRVSDIHKSFGSLEVLRASRSRYAPHEVVSVVGASGAGKTTLLQIIGTLSRPDSGRVEIDGADPFALGDRALSQFRNERIGFVFQFHHLLLEFSAFENVCIPGYIGRRPRAEVERRADELLSLVGPCGPSGPPPRPALRRRAAACGHCPGPHQRSGGSLGRRTFGQPRYAQPRGDPPPFLRPARRAGADHRHRYARREPLPPWPTGKSPCPMDGSFDRETLRELLSNGSTTPITARSSSPDDPISVPQRFTDPADREIAGFFAATIAWGSRPQIVRNGHRLMRLWTTLRPISCATPRNASWRDWTPSSTAPSGVAMPRFCPGAAPPR